MAERARYKFPIPPYREFGILDEGQLPRHSRLPVRILLLIIWFAWVYKILNGGNAEWGISAHALAEGQYANMFLHMFEHSSLVHIMFNSFVLYKFAVPLLSYLGEFPLNFLKLLVLLFLSGLAGSIVFLAINPFGITPMIGASGAICGLLGVSARLGDPHGTLLAVLSQKFRVRVSQFIIENLAFVLVVTLMLFIDGKEGGIAWEAHLGGFVAGMALAGWLVRQN